MYQEQYNTASREYAQADEAALLSVIIPATSADDPSAVTRYFGDNSVFKLQADWFSPTYAPIASAIQALVKRGKAVDTPSLITLISKDKRYRLNEIDAQDLLGTLATGPIAFAPDQHATAIIKHAQRYARQLASYELMRYAGDAARSSKIAGDLAAIASWLPNADALDGKARVEAHNLVEIMAMPDEPTKWVIPGMLPEGLTLFGGREKTGKSWLVSSMGLAVCAAGHVFGHVQVERGSVLYMALEDNNKRLKKRFGLMLNGERPPEGFDIRTTCRRGAAGVAEIEEWLKEHPSARLVIIDTLGRIKDRAKAQSGIMYDNDSAMIEPIHALGLKYGVAILAIHHLRKMAGEDPFDEFSGSTGLTASVDNMWVIKRVRGETDDGARHVTLHIRGRDIEDDQEHLLKWSAERSQWLITTDPTERPMTPERAEIIHALQNLGMATPTQVANHLGKEANTIKVMLFRMEAAGLIMKGQGKYYNLPNIPKSSNRSNPVTPVTPVTHVTQPTITPDSAGGYKGYSDVQETVTGSTLGDAKPQGYAVTTVTAVTDNLHFDEMAASASSRPHSSSAKPAPRDMCCYTGCTSHGTLRGDGYHVCDAHYVGA